MGAPKEVMLYLNSNKTLKKVEKQEKTLYTRRFDKFQVEISGEISSCFLIHEACSSEMEVISVSRGRES